MQSRSTARESMTQPRHTRSATPVTARAPVTAPMYLTAISTMI